MRFANDFHSWLRHSWKLLANRLTRDPKIVIHGNSCIILYLFNDADDKMAIFSSTLLDIAVDNIPKTSPFPKRKANPWFDEDCQAAKK